MRTFKRILTILVSAVMILSVTNLAAFADNEDVQSSAPTLSAAAESSQDENVCTFQPNGGDGVPVTLAAISGAAIGPLPSATKAGYKLKGWFSAKTGGTEITAATIPTDDATYYAQWTANRYKVTLSGNGGKMGSKTKIIKYITFDQKTGDLSEAKRNRSYFQGWYTAKTGGKKITEKTVWKIDKDTTLYARWKAATSLKLIFNTNGGKIGSSTKSYKYDSKISKMPAPSRSRYAFQGWYTAQYGGSWVGNGSKITSKDTELQLYARWAPHRYSQKDPRWSGRQYVSTIGGSGCAPSTMSMVVYTLKGQGVTPYTAARYSINHGYRTSAPGKTTMPFFVNFPQAYGVKSTPVMGGGDLRRMSSSAKQPYLDRMKKAVQNGNWVVAFMGPGQWTHVGHFILWYDIDGDRALIRDPNGTIPAKTRNTIKKFQSQVIRYWIITVPDNMKLRPE